MVIDPLIIQITPIVISGIALALTIVFRANKISFKRGEEHNKVENLENEVKILRDKVDELIKNVASISSVHGIMAGKVLTDNELKTFGENKK